MQLYYPDLSFSFKTYYMTFVLVLGVGGVGGWGEREREREREREFCTVLGTLFSFSFLHWGRHKVHNISSSSYHILCVSYALSSRVGVRIAI